MRTDVVALTEDLVRVDTAPGRSTEALADRLAADLAARGACVRRQVGRHAGLPQQNLVARFGGDGPAGLLLAGHLDTVPWEAGRRATTAPERDGRRLYGRGTADMKGAIAAQVLAAAACAPRLRRPLLLAYTYAEEVGCHGAQQLVGERALLGDLSQAACIVGEPTGLLPVTAHKGYVVLSLRLTGVPAHSSDPWSGADASVALGALLAGLHGLREELRAGAPPGSPHHPPCATLNTGLVSAGVARNVVPDRAEVTLELRPLPGDDLARLRRRVEACVARACASAPGVRGTVELVEDRPAFAQGRSGLVDWLAARTGHATGVVPFYTEAELYRAGLGVPVAVCGPGSIAQAHRVDESVLFDELEAGEALYRDAIETFCG